ncbi:MAG: cobalamin-binding protein [Candidatus Omnitrophica bacterium]|nr:cobalamin-binding protein [Candidatus Omnitrophota bacterium]
MRICSLLPSGTEILYGLGLGRSLVGRSDDCDYPAQVKRKPQVVTSRVARLAPQDSQKIHEAVLQLRRQRKHQFTLDIPALKKLKPDLVVTQNICAVCAASHPEVEAAMRELAPIPHMVSLSATKLRGVLEEIRLLGAATGRQTQAQKLIRQLEHRISRIQTKVQKTKTRPRVWCCEWLEPLMAAGHWLPELVALAGGQDRLGFPGDESRWLDWQEVRRYDPQVIIVMPCSYSIPQTVRERWRLTRRPGWKELSAVRNSRVFAVETSFFHRAGPRLVDGLELLAALIHPDLFSAAPLLKKRFRPLL